MTGERKLSLLKRARLGTGTTSAKLETEFSRSILT